MSVDRVDNIKDAPERALSRVIGHASDGKGGAATLENLKEQLAITAADVSGAVSDTRQVATENGIQGGGPLDGDLTLSLTDTGVSAGAYGSASAVPVITVDAQGRVTAAEEVEVEVPASGVVADTYGSATEVPVLTIGSDGRVTAAEVVAAAGGMAKSVYDPNDDGVVDYITDALAQAGGGEGGQINLEKASGSTLSGNVAIDTAAQNFRVFEQGGTARGVYIDLTECGAGAGSELLHEGNTTTAGRTLLTAADAAAQRTALGLAALAQKATIDNAALVADSILTFAKLASAAISDQPTAEAGTATDKLMTPQRTAQAIVAKSPATLSTTGAQTLPSGLLLKWGVVAAGASSGTVNFAAAFPNACLGVCLTVVGASGAAASYAALLDGEPVAASFAWYLRQTAAGGATGASTAVGFKWLAFGY